MNTIITTNTLPVCECCIVALANADTSGCEYGCGDGHAERLCEFGAGPREEVVPGDAVEGGGMIRCAGCGDDAIHAADVHVLEDVGMFPIAYGTNHVWAAIRATKDRRAARYLQYAVERWVDEGWVPSVGRMGLRPRSVVDVRRQAHYAAMVSRWYVRARQS